MHYFIYFFIFALFACSFQSLGVILSLYAFLKKRYDGIKFWMAMSTHAMALIIIRLLCDLELIKFGAHTVMILTCTILIGYFFIDKKVFKVSLSAIGAFALITVSEVINYIIFSFIFDKEKLKTILSATLLLDVETQTKKALVGIPSNVILFIVALLLYFILVVKKQSEKSSNNYDGFHE